MSIQTRLLNQTLTRWATDGDDSAGDPSFGAPAIQICRWEDTNFRFIGDDMEEHQAKSVIYVDADLALGDFVFLGTSVVLDPLTVLAAYRVLKYSKIPDATGFDFQRRAVV